MENTNNGNNGNNDNNGNNGNNYRPVKIAEDGTFSGRVVVGHVGDVRETKTGRHVINVAAYAPLTEAQAKANDAERVSLAWFGNLADIHGKNRKVGDCIWVKGKMQKREFTKQDGTRGTENQVTVQGFKLVSTAESRAAKAQGTN